ncbi:hypothetical protein OF117_19365 [Geodermatophilus sp. YIM 151500]|uniref:hypothetical protein n=1 Tax=Geodermatophilus sp. YIM 151500 TaxID=2984531 RepID=UPI0021E4B4F4|nr:hypothetical protein [Geodermatophilus sp. YIM 151500]MCV2491509.1 hypothetical protein [Geodermatophilus sp. YIM 151500]
MSESRTPGGTATAGPGSGTRPIAEVPAGPQPLAGGPTAQGQPSDAPPAGDVPDAAQAPGPGGSRSAAGAAGAHAATAGGAQAPAGGGAQVTAPVTVRPRVRGPRRGPLTRMGPWAPIAGLLLGLLVGAVVVLALAGSVAGFAERLSLVFAVVGLGILGSAATLLADEVGMLRHAARQSAVRPAAVGPVAALLTGLTPGRLLLLVGAFLLFVSAYVVR